VEPEVKYMEQFDHLLENIEFYFLFFYFLKIFFFTDDLESQPTVGWLQQTCFTSKIL